MKIVSIVNICLQIIKAVIALDLYGNKNVNEVGRYVYSVP